MNKKTKKEIKKRIEATFTNVIATVSLLDEDTMKWAGDLVQRVDDESKPLDDVSDDDIELAYEILNFSDNLRDWSKEVRVD